jgi:hypothetical protein
MAILLAVITTVVAIDHQRDLARSLIKDLEEMQVGSTNVRDVHAFITAHKLRPSRYDSPTPTEDSGVYETVLDNNFLARLHVAPWTRLGVLVRVENRTLSSVVVDYYVSCTGGMTSGVNVEEVPVSPGVPPYQLSVIPIGGKPPHIRITMTPAAPPAERSKAFGFDVACLTNFRGCSGASDLLPSAGRPGLSCNGGRAQSDNRIGQ